MTHIVHHLQSTDHPKIDAIVGLDSRGFLLGPWIASRLGAAFVPVRKSGKLPGKTVKVGYEKEYGTDYFEMQEDALKPGQHVVVLDDLIGNLGVHSSLATGGSAQAAGKLIKLSGAMTIEYVFFIELLALQGSSLLDAPTYSVIQFD